MPYVHKCTIKDLLNFGPDFGDLTCRQFADAIGCTRMGVYVAIKNGKIKASMPGARWMIPASELVDYQQRKYNRSYSKYKGGPLFDKSKGEYSIREAAEIIGCPYQHVYYAFIKKRFAKAFSKKCAWVVQLDDILKYKALREKEKEIDIHVF